MQPLGGLKHKTALDRNCFLNRSVKISHLAALKDQVNLAFFKGCEMTDFNGSSFYAS